MVNAWVPTLPLLLMNNVAATGAVSYGIWNRIWLADTLRIGHATPLINTAVPCIATGSGTVVCNPYAGARLVPETSTSSPGANPCVPDAQFTIDVTAGIPALIGFTPTVTVAVAEIPSKVAVMVLESDNWCAA